MKRGLMQLWNEEEGQDLVEYVLLVTVVALACVSGISTLSTALNTAFNSAGGTLSGT
jgi:Flp pilus assembly pilin Flp